MINMWILISLAVMLVIIGLVAIVFAKKGEMRKEPDYRGFFMGGVIVLCIGIGYSLFRGFESSMGLLGFGIIFMAIGLVHKNRWGKPRRKLTKKELKNKQILIGVVVLILVLLVAAMFLFSLN